MAQNRTWTITQSDVSRTFTISPGVGQTGPAGPNNITTATETDITGILKGDGANVSAAVEDTDYQGVPAEGAFIDGDKTKLDGIEAGADVTDAANVDAAGAVMESDYSPAHSVLAQQSGTGSPSSVTLGTNSLLGRASGAGTAIQGLTAAQARILLNVEDGATADQTAAEILTAIKTVDGTGSGLDADLLDGQEASAFATSAQGALADSAVQPGDIDTLAELNAIITDATLIDTTDSRLSDARTPTAHTHTASDLDFAGSTDIGADLADADEVLVSDGGGNTTRVKSALSRFWTYIKAKIESVGLSSLNITGDLTVDTDTLQVNSTTNEVTIAQDLYSQSPILVVNGFSSFDGGLSTFSVNAGTWNGSTITGDQSFTGDIQIDAAGGSHIAGTTITARSESGQQYVARFIGKNASYSGFSIVGATTADPFIQFGKGSDTAADFTIIEESSTELAIRGGNAVGGKILNLSSSGTLGFPLNSGTWDGATISGNQSFSGQVELTGQAASTDDSAMTKGLVRDFPSVWGNVYKLGNGETDTNNKLSTVFSGDRFFNFACYTGTAAGDGQWTTFQPTTFGLTYGSGAKGQLRDSFSFKFKFDSNTTTNTDVDLWLIRGKTANATLPVASDVCLALKFAGEEDLMIAVYDGVTAHTTTIDVSTINSWFTNLASQQEYMWTWDGTTAKVYGRYRKPAGTGDNDWSIWYTMGSMTPSGMSAGTTNLSFAGLHFLQHTPIPNTVFTKNFIIWDLEHTSHVIVPN